MKQEVVFCPTMVPWRVKTAVPARVVGSTGWDSNYHSSNHAPHRYSNTNGADKTLSIIPITHVKLETTLKENVNPSPLLATIVVAFHSCHQGEPLSRPVPVIRNVPLPFSISHMQNYSLFSWTVLKSTFIKTSGEQFYSSLKISIMLIFTNPNATLNVRWNWILSDAKSTMFIQITL